MARRTNGAESVFHLSGHDRIHSVEDTAGRELSGIERAWRNHGIACAQVRGALEARKLFSDKIDLGTAVDEHQFFVGHATRTDARQAAEKSCPLKTLTNCGEPGRAFRMIDTGEMTKEDVIEQETCLRALNRCRKRSRRQCDRQGNGE